MRYIISCFTFFGQLRGALFRAAGVAISARSPCDFHLHPLGKESPAGRKPDWHMQRSSFKRFQTLRKSKRHALNKSKWNPVSCGRRGAFGIEGSNNTPAEQYMV